jgi:hypothetical protein
MRQHHLSGHLPVSKKTSLAQPRLLSLARALNVNSCRVLPLSNLVTQHRGQCGNHTAPHLNHSASFGLHDPGDVYANALVRPIPADAMMVFERGFLPAEIRRAVTAGAENRYFLVPAKSNTQWEVIDGDERDAIAGLRVSPQTRQVAGITGFFGGHAHCGPSRSTGNGQSDTGRQVRALGVELHPSVSPDPVRVALGRHRTFRRQAASIPAACEGKAG